MSCVKIGDRFYGADATVVDEIARLRRTVESQAGQLAAMDANLKDAAGPATAAVTDSREQAWEQMRRELGTSYQRRPRAA
jgi:hypothetical protein